MKKVRIALAQINNKVGDITGNMQLMINAVHQARDELNAQLIIFPELSSVGYPPDDLLLRPYLYQQVNKALKKITEHADGIEIILGYPRMVGQYRYNAASFIGQQTIKSTYHKQKLPNYSVFNEKRYFTSGSENCLINLHGFKLPVALFICEDLWCDISLNQLKQHQPQLLVVLNASPFMQNKHIERSNILRNSAKYLNCPIIYINQVGGQDELVFDGGSLVIDRDGSVCHQAPYFNSALSIAEFNTPNNQTFRPIKTQIPSPMGDIALIYQALVLGFSDYVRKNAFQSALIGLSGGIDSALTLAIAVDALGSDNVQAILMPSRYTAQSSRDDALSQAKLLGVTCRVLSIEPAFKSFLKILETEFKHLSEDLTEQNIQARCRATILMAISNKKGALVLSTSNKSELAVGYTTLYGDMSGGFCVLKDILKTQVYQLAQYCNREKTRILPNIMTKAPSAELAPNQTDQDTIPDYSILDEIIERYVEKQQNLKQIVQAGIDQATAEHIIALINRSEYKRHQAPPGLCLSNNAFGRARRYPITSSYHNSI